jgi:methylated-DNA-protein-cysteine methyltransferase related protein
MNVPRFHRLVYRAVRQVPRGKVVTYGQVAAILGQPRAARAVGHALRMLPPTLIRIVPWQRVINAGGRISHRGDIFRPEQQRALLSAEGIRFDRGGKVDLKRVRWPGPSREWTARLSVDMPYETSAPSRRRRPPR